MERRSGGRMNKAEKRTPGKYLAGLFLCISLLSGLFLTGCGSENDTEGNEDIFTETEQMGDLTESVDKSQMIQYEYLGSLFYQGEKVQIWGERHIEGCRIYLHREDGSRELLAENVDPFDMLMGWWTDDQKRCFYKYRNTFVQISEKGEKTFTVEPEEEELLDRICQLDDGRIIVTSDRINSNSGTKIWEVNPDTGKLSELVQLPPDFFVSLIGSNGDELMILNNKGVWNVELSEGTLTCLMSFDGTSYTLKKDNYSFDGFLIREDMRMLEDGGVEILWSDGTSEFLNREQAGEGKETLVMRFMFPDSMIESWMKEQVTGFNRKSDQYYIRIDGCMLDSGGDMQEFTERTDMELAAGKGADIICCYAVNDACSLMEKGAFADLTPFMEESGIRQEDYFPAAFSGWRDGGKIYGLNCMVYMKGFWVDKAVAGDTSVTSVEELVDCLLNYDEEAMIPSSSSYILKTFLENSESLCGMVDFENGTCDFSGELFGKMLETAKRYEWDQSKTGYLRATGTSHYWSFFSFSDADYWDSLGKIPVGYLFDDGGHTKAYTDAMLAMNAGSANKEGVWEFFCYLLSEEVQSSFAVNDSSATEWRNYPVDREIFDQLCGKHTKYNSGYDNYMNSGGDTEFKDVLVTALTEKRKEELTAALEDARPAPLRTQPLVNIVVEEARSYFSGDKTIEEVCDMIQNRVQLYLNERK